MSTPVAAWRRLAGAALLALLLPALFACASKAGGAQRAVPAPMPAPPPGLLAPAAAGGSPQAPNFTFSAGDEFDLRVPDAPQFDQSLKVRPDGKVSLALVGTVHVQGRTPEDVQAELRERMVALAGVRGNREYLLQPGDEFDVKFPYQPQLNEAVRVRPDGKVQLQMIGTVQVEGASPEELRATLRERYARWLRNPELSVIVRSFGTQNVRIGGSGGTVGRAGLADLKPTLVVRNFQAPQVFVGGEVARPGVLAFRPGLSLLQAVVEAGGQLPSGDARQLLVLRRSSGAAAGGAAAQDGVQVIRAGFDAARLRQPDRDVMLQPFDIVLLPKSDPATLADTLNQYVFNLVPFLRNSSFGFAYNINGTR